MHRLAEKIKKEIMSGLPGREVQWEMASTDRMVKGINTVRNTDTIDAAVLILLYPVGNRIFTVFIQRPQYDGVHSGQISFPGGKRENIDKSLTDTAIRETFEETGVGADGLNIIGILTPLFIQVSNIEVTPVLAWCDVRPRFFPAVGEVVFLIEAPVDEFINGSLTRSMPYEVNGQEIAVKCFYYKDNIIWGATAMMFNELLAVLRRVADGSEE